MYLLVDVLYTRDRLSLVSQGWSAHGVHLRRPAQVFVSAAGFRRLSDLLGDMDLLADDRRLSLFVEKKKDWRITELQGGGAQSNIAFRAAWNRSEPTRRRMLATRSEPVPSTVFGTPRAELPRRYRGHAALKAQCLRVVRRLVCAAEIRRRRKDISILSLDSLMAGSHGRRWIDEFSCARRLLYSGRSDE
jgi:hypothetical protein